MTGSTLLVLAGDGDAAAAAFVARYRGQGARLMRPADLSCAGWAFRVGDAAGSVAMVGGERCPADSLRGVVTRLAGIHPLQLPHVADADRDYVAAEMSAFLIAWLSALPCPVMNRPAAPSLAGPDWRWERWARLALALDVPVAPVRRRAGREPGEAGGMPEQPQRFSFSVIGSALVGPHEPRVAAHARRLAEAACTPLLGTRFDDEGRLLGVDPWPDVGDAAIGAALFEQLQ